MKRVFAGLLAVLLTFSMFGCGGSTGDSEGSATTPPPVVEKKDYSAYAGIVHDPKTWYDELMALPIANDQMSEDELRQLCVAAMRFNLTFPWTPTQDIVYSFTLLDRTSDVELPAGIAYSGLFYCNNNARGNVWKALQHYDLETGTLDFDSIEGDFLSIMSSACARGVEWGWSRVSNSTGLETMASYSQYNSRVVPVGPYNYLPGKYPFGSSSGTADIIRDNGEDIMCQSYAAMKPADGLYSSTAYHVIMAGSDPVVVKDAEGNIDPEESYILILEQDAVGTKTEKKNYQQENGVTMRPLGTVDKKYTFANLLESGYVPFAIPELVGKDPVEAGEAKVGSLTSSLENGADIALSELLEKTVIANYAICTVEIQVKNPAGEVMVSHKYEHDTKPFDFNAPLGCSEFEEKAMPYANGSNTVHVYVRLSTGELKEAFTTVLK